MAPLISSPATVSYGAQLNFETLTDETSLRFQPLQDTLLRVIDGVAELRFDGEELLLGPGGEAVVPAGFHHPPPPPPPPPAPPPPRRASCRAPVRRVSNKAAIAPTRAYQPSRSRST